MQLHCKAGCRIYVITAVTHCTIACLCVVSSGTPSARRPTTFRGCPALGTARTRAAQQRACCPCALLPAAAPVASPALLLCLAPAACPQATRQFLLGRYWPATATSKLVRGVSDEAATRPYAGPSSASTQGMMSLHARGQPCGGCMCGRACPLVSPPAPGLCWWWHARRRVGARRCAFNAGGVDRRLHSSIPLQDSQIVYFYANEHSRPAAAQPDAGQARGSGPLAACGPVLAFMQQ